MFLGDFITCGVHVREGFCEKGVYFNEHIHDALFHEEEEQREVVFGLVVFRRYVIIP